MSRQPIKTYRSTWDELMHHHSEIAPDAVLEVLVYEPEAALTADQENQALIDLLRAWRMEDATDNPQELERRDEETNTLVTNLQSNRLSLPVPDIG